MGTRRGGASRVAVPAMLSALSFGVLYLANLAPSGRMGIVAVAGLVPAAAVISSGLGAGFACYAVTGVLGLLLAPEKGTALLYLLFFGLYPVVKGLITRIRRLPLEILCQLLFFNGVLSLLWFGLREIFLLFLPSPLGKYTWAVYVVGNAVFLLYDVGFTKLAALYTQRVERALKKGRAV